VGTGAHFQGIILAGTMMAVQTGATVKGRILITLGSPGFLTT